MFKDKFEDYGNNNCDYGNYENDSTDFNLDEGYVKEIDNDISEAFNNAYDEELNELDNDFDDELDHTLDEDQESDENQDSEDCNQDQDQNDNGNGGNKGNGYDEFLIYTLKSVILRDVYSDRLRELEDLEDDEIIPTESTEQKKEKLEHWFSRFKKVFELELKRELAKKYPEAYPQAISIWRPLNVHNGKIQMLSDWYNMMLDIIFDLEDEKARGDQKAQIDKVRNLLINAFKSELKESLVDNKLREQQKEDEKEYQQLVNDTYEMLVKSKDDPKYEE